MPGPFTTEWFYNNVSGAVISEPAIFGFAQPHFPDWHGPFPSKQAALDFYAANRSAHPGWKAPAGFGANVTNTVGAGAQNAIKDLTKGYGLIWPGAGHFMLRVGEFLVGGVLLAIGLNALLKSTTGHSGVDMGKTGVKVASKTTAAGKVVAKAVKR